MLISGRNHDSRFYFWQLQNLIMFTCYNKYIYIIPIKDENYYVGVGLLSRD